MKIVQYPHPALRHPAKPVTAIDKALRRLVGTMLELMYEKKGLGLAGPQVAMPFQVFVMNLEGKAEERDAQQVFINPIISDKKGMQEGDEGCLSFPDLYQKVRRPKELRVQAYDEEGRKIDRVVTDLEARVVQHETDHLHGKLFIDMFGIIAKLSSRGEIASFERDYRRAQERGEYPPNREIERQLKEWEAKGLAALDNVSPKDPPCIL